MLRQVCNKLEYLITQTVTLQYPILLAASGMRDNPRSPLSVGEKLQMLKEYDVRWNTLHSMEVSTYAATPRPGQNSSRNRVTVTGILEEYLDKAKK